MGMYQQIGTSHFACLKHSFARKQDYRLAKVTRKHGYYRIFTTKASNEMPQKLVTKYHKS